MAGWCSPESQGRKRSQYEVAERCRSWRRWTTPRKHTQDVTPSDRVKDIMTRIPINKRGREDSMYVTLEGKVLKLSDDVKGCGVRDGSTLHVNHRGSRMRRPWEQDAQQAEQDNGEAAKTRAPTCCEVSGEDQRGKSWPYVQQGQWGCGPAGVKHRTKFSRWDGGSGVFVTRHWSRGWSENRSNSRWHQERSQYTTHADWSIGEIREVVWLQHRGQKWGT